MWRFICGQSADIFNFCHHFVPASCSFEARLFDGEGVQPLSAHRGGGGGGDLTCQENFRFRTGTASLVWFLEVKTHMHTLNTEHRFKALNGTSAVRGEGIRSAPHWFCSGANRPQNTARVLKQVSPVTRRRGSLAAGGPITLESVWGYTIRWRTPRHPQPTEEQRGKVLYSIKTAGPTFMSNTLKSYAQV